MPQLWLTAEDQERKQLVISSCLRRWPWTAVQALGYLSLQMQCPKMELDNHIPIPTPSYLRVCGQLSYKLETAWT